MVDHEFEKVEALPEFAQQALDDNINANSAGDGDSRHTSALRDLALIVARPMAWENYQPHRFNLGWLRLMITLGGAIAALTLLITFGALALAAVLPHGDQIVYMASVPPYIDPNAPYPSYGIAQMDTFDIFLLDVDRGVTINLTNSPTTGDRYPAWSPDGTQIAFHSNRGGDWDIYVMDADGGNVRQLTNSPLIDAMPTWSPDGSQIAFHSERGGQFDLYVMNAADGSGQRAAFKFEYDELWPSWSPDGTKLLFSYNQQPPDDVETTQLYYYDLTTGASQKLTSGETQEMFAVWSPDGTQIAFNTNRYGDEDIFILDLATGITRNLTPQQTPFGYVSEKDAAWSPDGQRLAFIALDNNAWGLYSINVDGSNRQRLLLSASEIGAPDWRPR